MSHWNHLSRARWAAPSLAVAALIAVSVGGCAGSDGANGGPSTTPTTSPTVTGDTSAADLVPESIKSKGTITIAIPDTGAPIAYKDGDDLKGMDPLLAEELASILGLKADLQYVPFTQALTGLQSGRYDLSFGEFYITPERLKAADFVSNWSTYSSFLTRADDSFKPETLSDVCGHSVGAVAGSAELAFLQAGAKECEKQNKKSIDVHAFPDFNAAMLAVSSSRVDATMNDRGAEELAIQKGQPFKISGKAGGGPCSTAVRRTDDSAQMLQAVKKAYEIMISSGAYAKILDEAGTTYGAITDPEIYTADSTPPDYS